MDFLPLDKTFDRQDFDCGKPQLNDYLKKQARQHQQRHLTVVRVGVFPNAPKKIVGYYTLNASIIEYNSLPESSQKGLPSRLEIPAVKIGQLAVDKRYAKRKLGEELLMNALHRLYKQSDEIAIHAITVDALDDDAKRFWLRYDFIPFDDDAMALFLPMKTVSNLFK